VPEDTILSKLEGYRMGGEVSDRQWRDILGLLKIRAEDLDFNYLRRWAKELRVDDLLENARRQAEQTNVPSIFKWASPRLLVFA